MKDVMIFCALLSQSLITMGCHLFALQGQQQSASPPPAGNRQVSREWRAASYRGLKMGESTSTDMLRTFGEPNWSEVFDEEESNSEVWYHYEGAWEFPGRLTVVTDKRTGVILAIELHPNNLSKPEAIKHFGSDYVITRYDFDQCLGDEEAAPLYESPDGAAIFVEYRERGIAVSVDESGRVNEITYVSEPVGAPSSRCHRTSN